MSSQAPSGTRASLGGLRTAAAANSAISPHQAQDATPPVANMSALDGNDDGEEAEEAARRIPEDTFDDFGLQEVSRLAFWEVSSFKPGCGVDELRNESTDMFWQSDGPQPHYLRLHFNRQMHVVAIRFYVDATQDESYTPTRIGVEAGYGSSNIIEFAILQFDEPIGWQDVPFDDVGAPTPYRDREGKIQHENVLHTFKINFVIKENMQSGKDTHLRAVRVYVRHMDREKGYNGDISVPKPFKKRADKKSDKKKDGELEIDESIDALDLGAFSTIDYQMEEALR